MFLVTAYVTGAHIDNNATETIKQNKESALDPDKLVEKNLADNSLASLSAAEDEKKEKRGISDSILIGVGTALTGLGIGAASSHYRPPYGPGYGPGHGPGYGPHYGRPYHGPHYEGYEYGYETDY